MSTPARSANTDSTATSTNLVKALHLINGEHYSGAERVQDLLGMAMPAFGYEIGFVCLKPDRFPAVRQSQDCAIYELEMRNKFDVLRAHDIAKIARQDNYQIIHAHTPRTLMVARIAARKLRCPLVYHVHSPVGRDSARSFHNKVNSWIEKWSLRGVDQMICVSSSLAGYMQEQGHDAGKITVVNNGVAIIENQTHRAPTRTPWTLGTMALFRPRKGTEVLLDAVGQLKREGVAVNVRAVGPFETPEYETEIMNRVANLDIADCITWTGFQTDVNPQLDEMDLFVLPSLYGEGLPMVVLEAMANGIPVIASRVEGIPEAIRDNVDGLIFEPGSATDLAEKIKGLLGDQEKWKSLSNNSLHRQREKLSDASMARGVAAVYDAVLAEKQN